MLACRQPLLDYISTVIIRYNHIFQLIKISVVLTMVMQVSGTGHAGMEATIANCIEPGETIVVANSGIWGQRVCDLSERYGGLVLQPTHMSV